jgi:hypothetical protein
VDLHQSDELSLATGTVVVPDAVRARVCSPTFFVDPRHMPRDVNATWLLRAICLRPGKRHGDESHPRWCVRCKYVEGLHASISFTG